MRLQPVLVGLCIALFLGGPSAAQTIADERPRLLTAPSANDLNDHFPPVARASGISGEVSLNCVVHLDGRGDCTAQSETPTGRGFGDAAVRMAANWRFAPAMSAGQAVPDVSRVFRIVFANEETQSIPLSAGFIVTAQRETSASVRVDAEQNGIVVTGVRMALRPRERLLAIGVRDEPESAAPLLSDDRFYPEAARREGVAGVAIVACAVRSDGRPACGYEREFPEGFGFGDIAVDVAMQALQASPSTQTQSASFLRRFPVEFKFAHPSTAVEAPPPSPDRATEAAASPSFARQFPPRALERGISGSVMLVGTLRADRHFECSVAEETPTGWGFAAAALVMCRDFAVSEESIASRRSLVGERVFVPVTFRVIRQP